MSAAVALRRLPSAVFACLFLLPTATTANAQDPPAAPPTLVVFPFTIEGHARDSSEMRASAERIVQHVNRVLRADTTVRWLEYRPLQRPRDPETGAIVPARYGVLGAVRGGTSDSVWIRFQLVAVETLDLLVRDSVSARLGGEAVRATRIARRVVTALHEDAQRPRAPGPAAPSSTDPETLLRRDPTH